jgi:hypothetical protein
MPSPPWPWHSVPQNGLQPVCRWRDERWGFGKRRRISSPDPPKRRRRYWAPRLE